MKYPKPNIGDIIYIVPNQNLNRGAIPREETVTSVGRAYFNAGASKISIDDWGVFRGKDYSPIEEAYPSKETYDGIKRRKALWAKIINKNGSGILAEFELEELLRRLS